MKKQIITVILATIALFIWNAVSWMALPFHSNTLNTLPESVFNGSLLQQELGQDGIYHYPGLPESGGADEMESLLAKLKTGPRIPLMVYVNGETSFFSPADFAFSFLFNMLTVVLLVFVVFRLKVKSAKSILTTCLAMGLLTGFMSDLPQMSWFLYPLDFTLVNVLDHMVSAFLTGLIMAFYTYKKVAV